MVYQSYPGPEDPVAAGLPHYTRKTLPSPSGLAIPYWESTARQNVPTILYFHGNGGGLHYHVPMLDYLAKHHMHVIAMEYPGYPGAEGRPSEALLVAHAIALFDHAAQQNPAHQPMIWGFSLGSGVAVQLAAQRTPAALVLEAPFTAVVDRAAELYPIFPIHALMRNQFRSHEVINQIHAPLMILHGTDDFIIPIHHGRALFARANTPKMFKEYPGYGHLDLRDSSAYNDAIAFINSNVSQ